MNDRRDANKSIRRTAITLAVVAAAFYIAFILIGVLRS